MRYSTIAVLALGAMASPAMAQSFTGPHIDAQIGWDHLDLPDVTGTTSDRHVSDNRLIYGAGGGYDFSLGGPVIAGIDGDFNLGSRSGCATAVAVAGDRLCDRLVHDFDIGGRLGVHTGSTLFYGRAGYANSLIRSSYTLPAGTATVAERRDEGLRLGAGIEQQLGSGAYLKAEYRYTTASSLGDQHQLLTGIGFRF